MIAIKYTCKRMEYYLYCISMFYSSFIREALVARLLRPYLPLPSSLVATIIFGFFFRALKKVNFSRPLLPPPPLSDRATFFVASLIYNSSFKEFIYITDLIYIKTKHMEFY